jgi:glycosyltransferase involved in cell wall biosynthesis
MAPWYRELSALDGIDLEVLFLRQLNPVAQGVGFGHAFCWDLPLRHGYRNSIVNASTKLWKLPGDLVKTIAALRAIHPNVVVITGWNEPLLAAMIFVAKLFRFRILLRGESNQLRERSLRAKLFHRAILACASGVLTIGRSNRQFYEAYRYPSSRIFEGAYFVENDRMLAMAEANLRSASELRALDGANDNDVVFVFCGKHVAFKRPHLLVEAAAELVASGLRVKLRFAGSGELTESLRARCRQLGVSARFTGFLNQTEMWKAYVGGDVFVLPSNNQETWGLVVNEAMLFSLPVIVSSQVGSAQDLVVNSQTGWTFSDGASDLARVMRLAVENRSRLKAMGGAARERVQSKYSMDVATASFVDAVTVVSQ